MSDECLICKAPLEYLLEDEIMECAICHKREKSKTRCTKGHYVCSDCHTKGLDSIIGFCMTQKSKNPFEIIENMMDMPFCHMHGPEHHVMVGAALLTAYVNAGGKLNLKESLGEMISRGSQVPGGVCGFWGACGAGISAGIFFAIVTESTPLAKETWGMSNLMTSRALEKISATGGPRCCKRDSYSALLEAVEFTKEKLGVSMETYNVKCSRSAQNDQCLGMKCPYFVR